MRECKGEAGNFIVSAVLDYACVEEDVFLVATDTDLLLMLIYFWSNLMGHVVMKCEATRKHKATEVDIGRMANCLDNIQKYWTFTHAFGAFSSFCSR